MPSPGQISALQRSGSWQRTNSTTVEFDGKIGPGSDQGLTAALTPATTTARIASPGGDAIAALAVANILRQRGLTLDISTVCVGPCADYLFTAAKSRTMEPGSWLGFTPDLGSSTNVETAPSAAAPSAAASEVGTSQGAAASLAGGKSAVEEEVALYTASGLNVATFHDELMTALSTPSGVPPTSPVQVWIPTKTELAGLGLTGLGGVRTPATLTGANVDAQAWGMVARYENTVVGLTVAPAPASTVRPTLKAHIMTRAR